MSVSGHCDNREQASGEKVMATASAIIPARTRKITHATPTTLGGTPNMARERTFTRCPNISAAKSGLSFISSLITVIRPHRLVRLGRCRAAKGMGSSLAMGQMALQAHPRWAAIRRRSISPEFFASRNKAVMTEKKRPRKNQSQPFLPLFCAHSAQNAPNRKRTKPWSPTCLIFCSSVETRCSSWLTRCGSDWAKALPLSRTANIRRRWIRFIIFPMIV